MIKNNMLLVSLLVVNSMALAADVPNNSSCTNKADGCSAKNKKQEDLGKLIDKLFNKEDMVKSFNKSFEQFSQFFPKSQNSKGNNLIESMTDKIVEKITSPDLKKEFVKIYDENFNEEEVSDLVAFYSSKTGKKFIEKLPEITAESARISGEIMQTVMTEAFANLKEDAVSTEKTAKE